MTGAFGADCPWGACLAGCVLFVRALSMRVFKDVTAARKWLDSRMLAAGVPPGGERLALPV